MFSSMRKVAIAHAYERLTKAKAAVAAMEASTEFRSFGAAWSDFLIAASGIYSKLQQGAKSNGSSGGWFGKKMNARKTDELLRYIHHARNSDEHGLAPTTHLEPGSFAVGGGGSYRFDGIIGPGGSLAVTHLGGPPPRLEITPASVRLVTVFDEKHGNQYQPPAIHLGATLSDTSPLSVAKLGLAYLSALIAEADKLPE